MTGAASRWTDLVTARKAEMEQIRPGSSTTGGAFWDAQAKRFSARMQNARDPFIDRVLEVVDPDTSVLDVGAGSGRVALEVAPAVARVVAVDPSAAMLELLCEDAARRRLTNVASVKASWPQVEVDGADVVICAHVVTMIEDAAAFLGALHAHARARALVCMAAAGSDFLTDPLWRAFHGAPRRPGPTYLDALDVLHELGIDADAEVFELSRANRFAGIDEAMVQYRDILLLDDDASTTQRLEGLLRTWLIEDDDGVRAPIASVPCATLSWTTSA